MKIKIIGLLCLIILSSSCAVKSASLQEMIAKRLIETKKVATINPNVEIKINKKIELSNECKQEKSSFVPALLYWGWNSEVLCEFSKETVENELKNDLLTKIQNSELKKYFSDKKVIINIDELPTKFKYQENGNVFYLVVAYAMTENRYFSTELKNFKGTYKILDGENNIVFESDFTQGIKLLSQADNYKSTKKLSWQYIEAYNNELNRFVTVLLDEINAKIKQ
jgi:hypothetical protein